MTSAPDSSNSPAASLEESGYWEVYRAWQNDPEAFWAKAAEGLDWFKTWDRVASPLEDGRARWFEGALCNTCHNALDRHVEAGRGGQVALIYDSPLTGTQAKFTYAELHDEVATFAAVLAEKGIGKGDRVVLYMPMIPEAVVAMLACARLGAVHSVVFGGFAAHELATRIDDAAPKAIVSASCGIEPGRVIADRAAGEQAVEGVGIGANILRQGRKTCAQQDKSGGQRSQMHVSCPIFT